MVNDDNTSGRNESTDKSSADYLNDEKSSSVDRRTFLRAAGAGVAVTTVAGCTGGGDGDGDGGGNGGTATGTPTESISGPITIGAMGPADAPFGTSIFNSVELAVQEINDAGGIEGAELEVITKDTKDDPGTARQGYQELTTGENVDATFGIFGSEQLLTLMPNIAQQETVHLTAGAATPEAPAQVADDYDRFKYWFRVGPINSTFLAESMIIFAQDMFADMGWETIGILVEDFKWTEPVSSILDARFTDEVDVEVVYDERIAEGTEDFTPVYDEVENQGIDGLYTALAHIGTASLVQWAQQQRPFGYGGIHVPTQLPSFFDATQGAAITTFSQTTATPQSEVTEKTVPYANAYFDAYEGYPVYNGYSAYDAVYMYKNAVETAGTLNSDAVVSALEDMTYTGASGPIEFFPPDGEFPHDVRFGADYAQGVFFQWQVDEEGNGVQEVVWPDDLATSEYQSPPWA